MANELLTNRHQGSLKITVIPNNTHTKELPIFFFFFLTARHQARRFHHRRIIYWQGENRSQNLIGSYCETSHNLGIIMRCLDSLWNSSAISKTQIVTYLLNTIRPSSNYRKLDREYVFNALKTSVFRAVLRQKKKSNFFNGNWITDYYNNPHRFILHIDVVINTIDILVKRLTVQISNMKSPKNRLYSIQLTYTCH